MNDEGRLMLLATDRQKGKTTQAFAWVSHGQRVPGYPGWSRVLILAHLTAFDLWRRDYWARLEDFDHRVYTLTDWVGARAVRPDTQVCIDDLEHALQTTNLAHLPGRLVAATMTSRPWQRVEFQDRQEQPWLTR